MADPRKQVDFEGIEGGYATFAHDNSITWDEDLLGSSVTGRAVTLVGAGTVGLATAGSRVIGKLRKVDHDGFCTVQVHGFTNLPGVGTLTNGSSFVGALNGGQPGYITSATAATGAEVAAGLGTQIIDATDTTQVVVKFG